MRTFALLLLILWFSRIPALDALPLHNDEGLHLTRAVEVWNLHPFWEIRDGKIINQWAIALFYPQNAPVFAGRIATVFVSLIGFAAGYALIRRIFGKDAALMAGVLWIASPYLFFFERLALSDAEAGALVVLALWASWTLAERGTIRRAVFTGIALALATLFKFTAAPFALSVTLIVLLHARYPLQRRITLLAIVGIVVALCFVAPIGYLMIRGGDLFSIALAWVSGGSNAAGTGGIGANLAMLGSQLSDFGPPLWSIFLIIGLVLLLILRPRKGGILLLAVGLPLASIIVLGHEVLPRHYVVTLPAFLLLGGAGIGVAMDRLFEWKRPRITVSVTWTGFMASGYLTCFFWLVLPVGFLNFAQIAYTSPEILPLPNAVWTQYFSQHSSGYGLREAELAFPQTITLSDTLIIASMTGDSCRRANFYAINDLAMQCVSEAPGLPEIRAALETSPVVYVVIDAVTGAHFPQDAEALGAQAEQIAVYPRPGADGQPVTLWRLDAAR